MIKIRSGVISDLLAIAKVNVDCWRTIYHGIISEEVLKSKSYENCEFGWIKYFENQDDKNFMFVAVAHNSRIIGFCTGASIEIKIYIRNIMES